MKPTVYVDFRGVGNRLQQLPSRMLSAIEADVDVSNITTSYDVALPQ
jgi:hypothetical protein